MLWSVARIVRSATRFSREPGNRFRVALAFDPHAVLRVDSNPAQLMRFGEAIDERAKAFDQNVAARSVSRLGNGDGRAHVTPLGFGRSTSDHAVLTQGDEARQNRNRDTRRRQPKKSGFRSRCLAEAPRGSCSSPGTKHGQADHLTNTLSTSSLARCARRTGCVLWQLSQGSPQAEDGLLPGNYIYGSRFTCGRVGAVAKFSGRSPVSMRRNATISPTSASGSVSPS